VFPIQTPLNARISFFKYPLRALWKDYRDFVGNFRDGLIEPYLNINTVQRLKKMCSTGSLGDYLGLPTNYVGGYGDEVASDSSTSIMYSTSVRMPLPQTGESSWSFIQGLIGQNVNSNYASLAVNASGSIFVNQRMAITRWHKILTDESAVANMHGLQTIYRIHTKRTMRRQKVTKNRRNTSYLSCQIISMCPIKGINFNLVINIKSCVKWIFRCHTN
jgi:hypothetical protein